MPCRVRVYLMMVEKLRRKGNERRRRWFTVRSFSKRVAETDLSQLLLSLNK